MIKAVLGGGGRGMRLAETESDFLSALESAKKESHTAFNNSDMILEKFIVDPKHIEVQIIGDQQGKYYNTFLNF